MKTNGNHLSKAVVLRWVVLFAVVFAVSLPVTGRLCSASGNTYRVSVSSGYLALRTAKSFDRANEIGELYSGDMVEVSDYSDSTYWYVYSPKYGKYGYVNKDYLIAENSSSSNTSTWTVSVDEGYLALRTAKSFDRANEIGELYSGDTVDVTDSSDSTYWYVYSPKYGKYGYVNKNYLVSSCPSWTVSVDKGYLALRSAKSYDAKNEIGELYTGDTVEVLDSSDSTYWYVYSPKHDKNGYVNKDYLLSSGSSVNNTTSYPTRTVSVSKGYLALRTEKAYDAKNEIGELYSGDVVEVIDSSDSSYWYVYSSKLGKYGYVNKDYLR